MNDFYRLATSSTSLLLLSSPAVMHALYAPQQSPPPGYGEHGGWDNAPSEFNDVRKGVAFRTAWVGARKDYENHRQPNVNNRDEYRHPKCAP